MSGFDMAIGIDTNNVNQVATSIYQQTYPGIFKGSEQVEFAGAPLTLDYDVTAPPTFILKPPSSAESRDIVRSHLADAAELKHLDWSHDELTDAILTATQGNMFQIVMDDFNLTISDGDGKPATDKVHIVVHAQANSANGKLTLLPLKVIATAANPADQTLVQKFIVPRAMEMMKTLLSGISLPPLEIPGVTLTPPTMFILDERLIAVANKAEKPVPTPPFANPWPEESFFLLVSPELRANLASLADSQLNWSGHDSGSVGSSIGGASYSASAAMHNAHVTAPPGDPTRFDVSVQVSGNVSAGVTFLCIPVGVNYGLSTDVHAITASIQAHISGQHILATVQHVDNFVIILTPSGSIIEKVISAITWPITQAVVAAFSPAIKSTIEGVTIPTIPVPSFPFDMDNVHLEVTPQDLHLGNWNGYLMAAGHVAIN